MAKEMIDHSVKLAEATLEAFVKVEHELGDLRTGEVLHALVAVVGAALSRHPERERVKAMFLTELENAWPSFVKDWNKLTHRTRPKFG